MHTLQFRIGCDPEFTLFSNKQKLTAQPIIENLNQASRYGKISTDNHKETGELNPNPTESPQELTYNIYALLQTIKNQLPQTEILTSCKKGWIGGHIHLDITNNINRIWNKQIAQNINRILNFFWLLPAMNENPVNTIIRQQLGYASPHKLDDRYKENGQNTYEFRLPNAEWITYPKLCEATLAYIATIWHEISYGKLLQKAPNIIAVNPRQLDLLYESVIQNYKPIKEHLAKIIYQTVKEFQLYKKFKKEINYITNFKKIIETKEQLNYDAGIGWQKEDLWFNQIPKITIPNTINYQANGLSLPIYYNNDYNMEWIKQEITKNIIENNIKLETPLSLYGLKMGIETYLITNLNGVAEGKEIIKTHNDLEHIRDINQKILSRSTRKAIAIGIPYSHRQNGYIDPLILRLSNLNTLEFTNFDNIQIPKETNEDTKIELKQDDKVKLNIPPDTEPYHGWGSNGKNILKEIGIIKYIMGNDLIINFPNEPSFSALKEEVIKITNHVVIQ